jgi:hypothetical protein
MAYYTQNDVNEVIDSLTAVANKIYEKFAKESDLRLDDEDAVFDESVLHCELLKILGRLEQDASFLIKSYT